MVLKHFSLPLLSLTDNSEPPLPRSSQQRPEIVDGRSRAAHGGGSLDPTQTHPTNQSSSSQQAETVSTRLDGRVLVAGNGAAYTHCIFLQSLYPLHHNLTVMMVGLKKAAFLHAYSSPRTVPSSQRRDAHREHKDGEASKQPALHIRCKFLD